MKNWLTILAFCVAGFTAFGQEHRSAPANGENDGRLLLSPNPAASNVTIATPMALADNQTYHVRIYTMQGTLVEDRVVRGSGALVVNVDHLEDGVYIVAITDDNDYGRGSGRLVKRR